MTVKRVLKVGVQEWPLQCRRPVSAGAVPLGLGLSMNMAKRGTVPVRDETGRFTGVRPKTAAERLQVGALVHPRHAEDSLVISRRLAHLLQPYWCHAKLRIWLAKRCGLPNTVCMRSCS